MTISKVMHSMLQPIRIPISIFSASRPRMAASQIHSDEPQTCAMPKAELATPARSEKGPSAWLMATPKPTEKPAQIKVNPNSVIAREHDHPHDHFAAAHPDTDWRAAVEHGEAIGLGTTHYELVTV
mgnify:CR=1 FL=1